MNRTLRNAAVGYADRGWHVLPLRPRSKTPLAHLVPHGLRDASDDLALTLHRWTVAPGANVGIACGPSGFLALDVDPRHDGDDTMHALERRLGELPATIEAFSGGGGRHLLFRHPAVALRGSAGDGVDLKDHGYIVAAPSRHPDGPRYEWSVDGHPDEVALAALPEEWLEHVRAPAPAGTLSSGRLTPTDVVSDPLRRLPAASYIVRLCGRETNARGFVCCPFHGGGSERTPSLKVDGTLWACHACDPPPGRRVLGGNIYDFAGCLYGVPIPLRGPDFGDVRARLLRTFNVD